MARFRRSFAEWLGDLFSLETVVVLLFGLLNLFALAVFVLLWWLWWKTGHALGEEFGEWARYLFWFVGAFLLLHGGGRVVERFRD